MAPRTKHLEHLAEIPLFSALSKRDLGRIAKASNEVTVEAGHVLGWVGDTGDASGGPTHLHIELHPDGGDAVDPFPLLKVVSDAETRPRP